MLIIGLFVLTFPLASTLRTSSASVAHGTSVVSSTITEWAVPTLKSGVLGLTLDPSGECCWFLEYYGNNIGHLDPSTGIFQEWPIPTAVANPYSLAVTAGSGSAVLWGTESGTDKVFQFSPESGLFREYNVSRFKNGENGLTYISVEPGTQFRVWFTESFRNRNGEFVYDAKTGNVTMYEDIFPAAAGGGAYGVYATSSSVWFAGFSALVRWDRASQEYTMWPLPIHGTSTGRVVAFDQSGELWYTQGTNDGNSTENYVGVLRANATLQEWRIPNPGADPRGISLSPFTQNPWVAETSQLSGNGAIVNLDPTNNGTFVPSISSIAPSAGSPVVITPVSSVASDSSTAETSTTNTIVGSFRGQFIEYALGRVQPQETVVDRFGNVWFSEPGANKIGRLSFGPDFALRTSPQFISLSPGGSQTVTVTGTSLSSYAGDVTLSIKSVPANVTVSNLSPNFLNITSSNSPSSALTVQISASASPSLSTIILQGSDGTTTHLSSLIVSVTNSTISSTPKCLIATATYGSESSFEVQVLRNFRDNDVGKSKLGSSFLIIFNAWYYSFSPYVASYLKNHEIERTGTRFLLYPLISFLYVASRLYDVLSTYPDLAILVSGLQASSLIGAFYLGLPLGLIVRRLRLARYLNANIPGVFLLAGLGATLLARAVSYDILLMASSSLTVLAACFTSAIITAIQFSRKFDKSE